MHIRKLYSWLAGMTAVMALTSAGSIGPAYAATPPQREPAQTLESKAGISDTCTDIRSQLPTLAGQGHAFAGCITIPSTTSARSTTQLASAESAASISAPSWCTAGSGWMGFRDEMCEISSTQLNWYNTSNGQLIGTAQFTITQDIQLVYNNRTFAENFDLQVTRYSSRTS